MPDLGLFELLGPFELEGPDFGPIWHTLLSILYVDSMQSAYDDEHVCMSGIARIDKAHLDDAHIGPGLSFSFGGSVDQTHDAQHTRPAGAVWDWHDVTFQFRISAPRTPSAVIATAMGTAPVDNDLAKVFAAFGDSSVGPSDYPDVQYRIDLLLTAATVHLPFLHGATLDSATGVLKPINDPAVSDPAKKKDDDVSIVLPKILVTLTQSASGDLGADLDSWGAQTIDDPDDRGEAQLIQMVPPYAFVGSGTYVGFGFDKATLDLSDEHTPPEMLSQFGVGDDWQGIYIPDVRIYVAPKGATGMAVDVAAHDLLVGLGRSEGVSGDFELDVVNLGNPPKLHVIFYDAHDPTKSFEPTITEVDPANSTGSVTLPADSTIVVDVYDAYPPYHVQVDGVDITGTGQRTAVHLAGNRPIVITVDDSAASLKHVTLTIDATLNLASVPAPPKPPAVGHQPATLVPAHPANGIHTIARAGDFFSADPTTVTLAFAPFVSGIKVEVDSDPITILATPSLTLDLPPGAKKTVTATWPGATNGSTVDLHAWYHFDNPPRPLNPSLASLPSTNLAAAPSLQGIPDFAYVDQRAPEPNVSPDEDDTQDTHSHRFSTHVLDSGAMRTFGDQIPDDAAITINGFASYEGYDEKSTYNLQLSERRGVAFARLITEYLEANHPGKPVTITQTPEGNTIDDAVLPGGIAARTQYADGTNGAYRYSDYWLAYAAYTLNTTSADIVVTASVSRPLDNAPPPPAPAPRLDPPATGNVARPAFFHRIKIVVRISQNAFIALEVSGEVDFQTAAEDRLQAAAAGTSHAGESPSLGTPTMLPGASANPNPDDGVVDIDLIISHDDAKGEWREQLTIGAGKNDKDGLARWGELPAPDAPDPSVLFWRDVLGNYIVLAPLLDAAAASAASGGDVVPIVVESAIPFALAALDLVHAEAITLYGGELILRERDSGSDATLLFDVEADLWIDIEVAGIKLLTCKPSLPVKVRYKAVGIRLNFGATEHKPLFEPMFDASQGFSIDVTDPGMFKVPEPLGDIIQVLGARIARTNPLNLEVDIGLAVNLGVISIDRAKVRLPIDPVGAPTITAIGAGIDIPGAFEGRGYIDLSGGGFLGKLDLTLVPIHLRIAAGLSVQRTPPDAGGNTATGVLITLEVDFPAPIVLGSSGLGIYGLLGLFGMHFHRTENPAGLPTPALDWFINIAHGDATDVTHGWGALIDHWAFGVGVVIGTLEGGFVINLKGVLIFELPGPRLLLFMKANILSLNRPDVGDKSAEGVILAVLDIDFGRGTLSIGLEIDYNIDPLLAITIPADAFFDFTDPSNFALDIGTIKHPASAHVFAMFRADGYLEIHGHDIPDFPLGALTGFAIALGMHVSLLWGDESIGLYLKISAGADIGVGFSPFRLLGKISVSGQLHLFIVDIGASAELDVEADAHHVKIHGEICGEVDFFFFSVSACVGFALGDDPSPPDAPPLLRNLYLQSRTPALVNGTGTDRPIDGSLGNALPQGQTPKFKVPIDSIPVLQMECGAGQDPGFTSFTQKPGDAPTRPPSGWCKRGKYYYRYTLTSLAIVGPALLNDASGTPSTWRSHNPTANGDDNAADLALLDWCPNATPKAVQSSDVLDEQITHRWRTVCAPTAPPTTVLWTFQRAKLGSSAPGWMLQGIAWPDPPGTTRSAPPLLGMRVWEAWRSGNALLDALQPIEPARVVGLNVPCQGDVVNRGSLGQPTRLAESPLPILSRVLPERTLSVATLTGALATQERTLSPVIEPTAALTNVPGAPRECQSRVLQAPFENAREKRGDVFDTLLGRAHKTPKSVDDLGDVVLVEAEALTHVRLFLLVLTELFRYRAFVVRPLDVNDDALGPDIVIGGAVVASESDLPAQWLDPAGPWKHDVDLDWWFFASVDPGIASSHLRVLADVPLPANTARFALGVKDWQRISTPFRLDRPSYLVAAIEGTSAAEVGRSDYDTTQKKNDITHLEGLLAGDPATLPLFAPNADYAITLSYNWEVAKDDSGTPSPIGGANPASQTLHFLTDNVPPPRLDPWMLTLFPSDGEQFHFYEDPITVVFATDAVTELFAAYGVTLRGTVRAASFRPPASSPHYPKTHAPIGPLEKLGGIVLDPFEEGVRALAPGIAPCVDTSGVSVRHAKQILDLFLDPLTEYVFDIEPDPPPALPPNEIVKPLYRSSFATSRYRNLDEMIADIGGSKILHRRLASGSSAALKALPVDPTDAQLDDALRAAGLGTVARASQPAITILWEDAAPHAEPVGALLDAPEPLRRARTEPTPTYDPKRAGRVTQWNLAPAIWLDLGEAPPLLPFVKRFAYAPGGARVFIEFEPNALGGEVHVSVVQHERVPIESATADVATPLMILSLSRAPWET